MVDGCDTPMCEEIFRLSVQKLDSVNVGKWYGGQKWGPRSFRAWLSLPSQFARRELASHSKECRSHCHKQALRYSKPKGFLCVEDGSEILAGKLSSVSAL
jgi:hypothetical protein